ncbi:MAG TPA: type VI secretion system ImpA family N-terminal domain-containing protein [Pyrinomonadaceae bacterium]|nr:type VI secretion system ImpA family N-terminal domain-containing protein [Pyrinomonadaceae bacterium]
MSTVTEERPPLAAPEVVDTEALLAPLGGAGGAGEDARNTAEYDAVDREVKAARAAGVMLPGDDGGQERRGANWLKVEQDSIEILRARSKDIKVCAWMTEALVNNHGFAGLRDGLRVMAGIHERFWETFYPEIYRGDEEPDDEGNAPPLPDDAYDARILALEAMDRAVAAALRNVPLTRSVFGAHSFEKFEYSSKFVVPEDMGSLDEQDRRYIETAKAEGKITAEQWQKAKDATPADFYKLQFALLGECSATVAALKRVLDGLYENAPGLPQLEKTLEQLTAAVRNILKEKGYDPEGRGEPSASDAEQGGGDGATGGGAALSSGPVGSRVEALRKLQDVADFFRRTEPHSPVSYLVQRAVKWGHMPLDAWLREVLKNDAELAQVRETLGLGPAPPAEDGDKNLDET